jgi:predicted transcriptional regulator of viral defense system
MAIKLFPPQDMSLFTTREFSESEDVSMAVASRRLNELEKSGILEKLARGLWWQKSHGSVSRYSLVPKLLGKEHGYISFLTALNYHDVIEQIPGSVMVATTGYPRKVKTKLGIFEFLHVSPAMMTAGFDWQGSTNPFLIASPEKALLDTFYISTRKGRRFSRLPELDTSLIRQRKFASLLKSQVAYPSISQAIRQRFASL